MPKSIIIIGSGNDMLLRASFQFRDLLANSSDMKNEDIHVMLADSFQPHKTLQALEERFSVQNPKEPLLITYIGEGSQEGWVFNFSKHQSLVKYTAVAELLKPLKCPTLLINCCYYSKYSLKPFSQLLRRRKRFGIINPFRTTNGSWHGYFLSTEMGLSLKGKLVYDPEFWNLHTRDILFGFYPHKPDIVTEPDGFIKIRTPNDPPPQYDPPQGRSRQGAVLDHYFWTVTAASDEQPA